VDLLKQYPVLLNWDKRSQTPYFEYSKEDIRHEVWFENRNSLTKKIELIKKYKIEQIAIWHAGMLNTSFLKPLEEFLE
jgi:spore germination protein YaaH